MQFIQSQNYSDFVVSLFAVKAKHHDQPPISSLKTLYSVRHANIGSKGIKPFSCSTQLRTNIKLLMNVKIAGINEMFMFKSMVMFKSRSAG